MLCALHSGLRFTRRFCKPFATSFNSVTMQQPSCLAAVADFHRLFQAPILSVPTIPAPKRCELRVSLIREELNELADAIKENDLIEVADALADIQYVLSGAVLEFGLGASFAALFDEIQRARMSVACSTTEEAEATRSHYKAKENADFTIDRVSDSQFLVRRQDESGDFVNSVNYAPADVSPIVAQAPELAKLPGAGTTMPDTLNAVAAFHKLTRTPILDTPQIPSAERTDLRVSLIAKELQAMENAIKDNSIVGIADALGDIQYELSGAILEFGMGNLFKQLFDEVQRSNMSKACATLEEAEATQKHYRTTYNPPTDSTIEKVSSIRLRCFVFICSRTHPCCCDTTSRWKGSILCTVPATRKF